MGIDSRQQHGSSHRARQECVGAAGSRVDQQGLGFQGVYHLPTNQGDSRRGAAVDPTLRSQRRTGHVRPGVRSGTIQLGQPPSGHWSNTLMNMNASEGFGKAIPS
eukprot:2504483-Rhodomonas_salina.5